MLLGRKEIIKIKVEINEIEKKKIDNQELKKRKENSQIFSQREKEKTQITKTRKESGDITTDLTEIKKTMREQYEQLHANKGDLDENDKLLETPKLPKLTQGETEHLNRPIRNQ